MPLWFDERQLRARDRRRLTLSIMSQQSPQQTLFEKGGLGDQDTASSDVSRFAAHPAPYYYYVEGENDTDEANRRPPPPSEKATRLVRQHLVLRGLRDLVGASLHERAERQSAKFRWSDRDPEHDRVDEIADYVLESGVIATRHRSGDEKLVLRKRVNRAGQGEQHFGSHGQRTGVQMINDGIEDGGLSKG